MQMIIISALVALIFILPEMAVSQGLSILSVRSYIKLSENNKLTYLNAVREEWNKFEKTTHIKLKKKTSIWSFIIPSANAERAISECLIGGHIGRITLIQRAVVVCEALEHACKTNSIEDGFQCGRIYGNICVNASLKNGISYNCYAGSKEIILQPNAYRDAIQDITGAYEKFCNNGDINTGVAQENQDACLSLRDRLKYLDEQYKAIAQSGTVRQRSGGATTTK